MHSRSSIREGLTLYDSNMKDDERKTVRTAQRIHLVTWIMNVLIIWYLIYRLAMEFESIFMGYVMYSCFALIASILYARRYKSWYAHNILIYFILFVFIVINIMMLWVTILAEFFPLEQYSRFRKGNIHWGMTVATIVFFSIPVIHSLAIIYLFSARKTIEHRILAERGGVKTAKGKNVLDYTPQVDDIENNKIRASKNIN